MEIPKRARIDETNRLRKKIFEFHEQIKPILEKVLKQYNEKPTQKIYDTIVKPCKRLIQKCSFKSVSDTSALNSLAYWLYIYENQKLALEICELTHGIEFVFEDWKSGILNIYGLEIRIARELLEEDRRNLIASNLLEYYFSKKVQKEIRYPQILKEAEISTCNHQFLETELLYALYHMIGKGETGLYTELNKNWKRIEQAILEYIDYLK